MKNLINRLVFFIGWLLSPLTFWNDVFVNIPIAYLCASLYTRIFSANFLIATLVFYWLSNALGILMMYLSGKKIFKSGKDALRELVILAITIALYSIALILLHKTGILRPI